MNVKLLIDAVTRQTTVLIAQLATTAGIRAPLAHVANQVFLDLAEAIEEEGVTRKVAADMFGLALRSYQLKVQRLQASATEDNISLWEAVLSYIRDNGVVQRADVLRRFRYDDEASVKGLLRDLVETGLVFKTGKGDAVSYRAASEEELGAIYPGISDEDAAAIVWIKVYRDGPVSMDVLRDELKLESGDVDSAVDELLGDGRIRETVGDDGVTRFDCEVCVIPVDAPFGWEAGLFDHFGAMVQAIGLKLRKGRVSSRGVDIIGGSTYSFDVWDGHPHRDEAMGLLRETRERISALRKQITEYNEKHGRPADGGSKVTFYFGQSVVAPDEELD